MYQLDPTPIIRTHNPVYVAHPIVMLNQYIHVHIYIYVHTYTHTYIQVTYIHTYYIYRKPTVPPNSQPHSVLGVRYRYA